MIAILFSCTFALAAEGYKMHHRNSCEEQNERLKCSHKLQYFTQGILYYFHCMKVKDFLKAIVSTEK